MLLTTPRLIVMTTPLDVVQQRLIDDHFACDVPVSGQRWRVTFPPEWPGDALVLFPMLAEHYNPEDWGGMVIDRAERIAVGQIGTKGQPDAAGRIEIGYCINQAFWGRGYASEAVGALVEFLFTQPTVHIIAAETRTDNTASMRVLEKLRFARVGERFDQEDGDLFLWELRA